MSWSILNENERKIVLKCLIAATEGTFFPDWEFDTIMFCSRSEIEEIITKWNEIDRSSDEVTDLVISVLNNLVGYPHGEDEALKNYTSVDRITLIEILNKLKL